jgi:hypothetical protein
MLALQGYVSLQKHCHMSEICFIICCHCYRAAGRPFPINEAWALGASDLLEHFEETDSWESASRLFMVRRRHTFGSRSNVGNVLEHDFWCAGLRTLL